MAAPGLSGMRLGEQTGPNPGIPAEPSIHHLSHHSAGAGPQDMPRTGSQPRMFHTRHGRHVTFDWLEQNMTLAKSMTYYERLVPLEPKFGIPVVLIHGICHSSSVSSCFHKVPDIKY